jgi:hypothetical protein
MATFLCVDWWLFIDLKILSDLSKSSIHRSHGNIVHFTAHWANAAFLCVDWWLFTDLKNVSDLSGSARTVVWSLDLVMGSMICLMCLSVCFLQDLQCQNLDLEGDLFSVKQEAEHMRQACMDKTRVSTGLFVFYSSVEWNVLNFEQVPFSSVFVCVLYFSGIVR